jgi:adenylate cyclase
MAEKGFKRKLVAILSADVEGYSRLMGKDEDATIRTLTTFRELMFTIIHKHRGRVVDSPGDNLLAEFGSVVDAVRCAVEIQEELRVRNAELPDSRRMEFRIGINLGDVVEEGERIYGDGVNITARVEGLAEGGGICISGKVYEEVEGKLGLEYEYLGKQEVKNIEKPIPVHRVLFFSGAAAHRQPETPSVEPASVERMALPLPDKPSIAVLPFVDMSGDPEQEYLSDGITDQIITGLSKIPKLFVIASQSSFTYKGKSVKIQKVAEDLGVRYVLEGSIQRSAERIRITAQLIDAITGHHLWAERYDRDIGDIFALQDDITMNIMTAMQVKLTLGEQQRYLEKGTDNYEAYMKYIQAYDFLYKFNKDDNILSRRMAEESIALDPRFAAPYSVLGWTHYVDLRSGWSKSPEQSFSQGMELAKKALAMDDSLPCAHGLLGWLYMITGKYEKANAECRRALEVGPNQEETYKYLGWSLIYSGRSEEATPILERGIRLSPSSPASTTLQGLGLANLFTGRYEQAISACKKAVAVTPNALAHLFLTVAYSAAGREGEARAEAEEILRVNPKFSVDQVAGTWVYKRKADIEVLVNALHKAGLK